MTINEFIDKVNAMEQAHGNMTMRVQAFGGLTGYPTVVDVCLGFDWNTNSVVLIPSSNLTLKTK
jgi:hypothetical protein